MGNNYTVKVGTGSEEWEISFVYMSRVLMLAARTCDSCISLVTITELSALFHAVTIIKLLIVNSTNRAFGL